MSFISLIFLGILITIMYFVFYNKYQWIVLLIINIVFYVYLGGWFLSYLVFTALITYIAAIKLETVGKIGKHLVSISNDNTVKKVIRKNIFQVKKILCTIAIVLGMGLWIRAKYANFFIDNINKVFGLLRVDQQIEHISIVLPLGISFYTFHAVGYVVDVYRDKYPAEKNFLKYFTFVSFFLHIVQGPFSRFDELGKSIFQKHLFSYTRLCEGCSRILWGITKKMVIADKINIVIDTIFICYFDYTGIYIIFAIICYSIQLYADFSGYMDIVCGFSYILGISLKENFRQPYFAKSIDEFWRRWHISLGAWFKDYVFYPVSMGKIIQKISKWARKKWGTKTSRLLPGYFALFFVWSATGLWHGANWGYLIWGYLNLLAISFTMQFSDFFEKMRKKIHFNSNCFLWKLFSMIRTFVLLCFFRLFAMADSIYDAIAMLKLIFFKSDFSVLKSPEILFIGMRHSEIVVFIIGVITLLMIDVLKEMKKWEKIKTRCPMVLRNLIYTSLIFSIILFAGESNDLIGRFMYANF